MDSSPGRSGSSGTLSRAQTRSSIRYSIGEGVASAASEGATEEYYLPYALASGASASAVGWLVALAQLALSICYLKVPDYVRKMGSRKRSILILVLVDVVTFLPFVILPFLVKDYLVQTIFLLYILSVVPTIVVGPIWASWMTDLVPVGVRGRYLGQRLTFMGASELTCFVAAGLILNWFAGNSFAGFSIIFSFAAVARLASWFMYWKMKDIPITRREEVSHFGFHDVIPAVRNGSVGRFMRFAASLYFAVFLAQPFFVVFMLSELHFSYLEFMIVICSEQVARLVVLRFWGRYADTRGSLKVVRLVSVAIPVVPLLWLVSQNIVYLVFVQAITGVAMAGFELGAANFMYGAAPAGSRIKYIALFRALNGVGAAFGALLGGYLAVILVPIFGHKLLALFLLSGLLRGVVVLKLLPSIVDVSLKRIASSGWDAYRPRGMLAADAITDVFGWGLLYIPESMQRNIRRAFESPRQAHSEDDSRVGIERLFHRWVRLLGKHQEVEKPSLAAGNNEEREELRLASLRSLAARQVVEKANAVKQGPPAGGKVRWSGEGLWRSLRKRFGVKLESSLPADVVSPKVALLHNVHLGQKLVAAAIDRNRCAVDAPLCGPRDELHRRWSLEALQKRSHSAGQSAAEASNTCNSEPLRDSKAWYAHISRVRDLGKKETSNGQLRTQTRIIGLLYRDNARALFEGRSYGKNLGGRSDAGTRLSRREGLLHNTQAWGRYLGGSGDGPAGPHSVGYTDGTRRLAFRQRSWDKRIL